MARQPAIYAPLSTEAKAGWKAFTTAHGITQTALCEALGLEFADPPKTLPPMLRSVVATALAITSSRLDRSHLTDEVSQMR